jgi:hypothetical protein
MGVDDAKFITDKGDIEEMGVTKRKQIDSELWGSGHAIDL